MNDLNKIKKDFIKNNKVIVEGQLAIYNRYTNLTKTIGGRDHPVYLSEMYKKAQKDMKWNAKCRKKYATVNECFFDRTIPEYFPIAQNAMYGMFTDILSYRDWTETTEQLNIMESKSPFLNIMIFIKHYFDEWKELINRDDYETGFRDRFEKRFGNPEYIASVPESRALNIGVLCQAAFKYYNYITLNLGISDSELLAFMDDEKFVGQGNTNFLLWNSNQIVGHYVDESIDLLDRNEDDERHKEECKYFDVFTFAVNNPDKNRYSVDLLNVALEYKAQYGISLIESVRKMNEDIYSEKEVEEYTSMLSYGYLAYFPKPFGVD